LKFVFFKVSFIPSILFAFSATAKQKEEIIELKDNKPILGKWMMYGETPQLHIPIKKVKNEWTFGRDGNISVISRDPRMTSMQRLKVSYTVEDGVIKKQFTPGRTKTENCKVIKLEGKDMTLHCKFNYYLFKKM
jgi:hypothetical protein